MSLGVIGEKNYCTRSKVSFEILKEEYSQLLAAMKDTSNGTHFNKEAVINIHPNSA